MELKAGDVIRLLESNETFIINGVYPDGRVDMTATKQYNPDIGLCFHEKFFSVKLTNYEIV